MVLARLSSWLSSPIRQQQPGGVVEDRAGMFHAAELKRRNEHEVELPERIRNARVVLEPRQRGCVQVEDRVAVARHLLRVGFAVEHAKRPAVALGRFDREPAGGEREEVGRERLVSANRTLTRSPRARADLGAVRNRLPCRRQRQRQRVARLEVRLVEAREREVRAGRHEDRVEKIGIPIEGCIAGAKDDVERVRPRRSVVPWMTM